jgi:hypothetical protein
MDEEIDRVGRQIPQFDRRIFWDVDFDALDYDGRAEFVIERVFERGDVGDINKKVRNFLQ